MKKKALIRHKIRFGVLDSLEELKKEIERLKQNEKKRERELRSDKKMKNDAKQKDENKKKKNVKPSIPKKPSIIVQSEEKAQKRASDYFGTAKERGNLLHDKYIQFLLESFKKNKVLKNKVTLEFVENLLKELPVNLIDNMYEIYSDFELIKTL